MDYPENWPQPSGLTAEGATLFSSAFSSAASKDDDWWNRAEDQAAELIASIQPIPSSEKRRQAIVDFVQDLIEKCFNFYVQVETFGSVPLKTYLPDGDIDLTALSVYTDLKETWAQDVVKALKVAEENADAQFRVKDVQYIQADVKIIKCLVENIVVDISFNQTGGLCTFCFLEQVDRYIGRDHLFKKSIILVKAWCYYESRLLGAHHGLISTYALETLVLYIFHVFHSSLRGPLKVLYTFLVYFSNFDWDKYCVSLWGPVPLALITERISVDFAESPLNDGGSLLLTKEFLDRCIEDYSGVSAGPESNQGRHFIAKFLNVLDPIRDTNNLGRSVNLGSFKRIRSAFGLGARTLGEVLECSEDQINERFKSFFSCTFKSLERYRNGGRPDTGNSFSHGVQHPTSGAGGSNFHERLSSGYKQEKGADTRHSPRTTTYIGENVRPLFQFNYGWPGQFDPRPMDTSELPNEIQGDSIMRTRATPTMIDVPFSHSSGKDSGTTGNTVVSAPDTKQERFRTTEPNLTQPISSNLNVANSEGQWRQAGGKGRYTSVEGDTARAQAQGSNYYTAQENFDRSMPNNRRSSEDHEHANHSVFRSPMVGEYQARAPSQDSPRWGSSRGDLVGQGSVSRSRDVSDPSLSLSNHDVGRPPGPLGDSKTSSSHRNSNRKVSSGDENDTSTSGRKTASSEESKATYNKWVPHQRAYTSPGDISYQGNSQDSGNQNMLQPLPYFPPFLRLPSHTYPAPMHLPVSSAIPVPASSSSGPPSASSLHSTHHSPSSGESFPNRTNSYVAMQIPPILPPALPATSSCMVSVAPPGDGASSHIAGFSPRAEEQLEHWRSPVEDQMQPLHRASVPSSASPGRSFPMESTSLSEGYPSPFSVAPLVQPQFVLGRLKPAQGGSVRSFEGAEFPKAYGPIDENLSRLSINDERPGESSSQLEEGADYSAPGTRNRENRPSGSEGKISDGKHAKGTKGAEQLSRSQSSSSDKSDRDVSRHVDGHAAELRLHRINHPSFEETSVRDMQGALLPPFPSPPHSHQEILSTSLPSYHRSSPIQSGTLEPASTVPYQSLQVPTPQASAGTDSTSPSTSDRQVLLPVSVGIPGAPGSMHPPIIEHGSISMGPSFRNRPMETVLLPVTVPQPMYFYYPPIFVMPTGTEGIFRGDPVGGLHSNGSIDFGTDIQGSQSLKDARPRTLPQVGMGYAERPKGAGAVMSPRNKVDTSNVERMNDEAGPSDLQEDILSGSSKTHKESLLRSFQYSCMGFLSPNFATRSPKGPQLWEGSGRQKGNLNLHAGPNISQPLGGAGPSHPSRGRVAEGTQQSRGFAFHGNEDTLPKPRAGTGAYLPAPRQSYSNRGRPSPSGRGGNQHGAYGQQDRNTLEGTNQLHAPRYRSVGQGQGQQNKHEPRAQTMMNAQKNPAPDLGDSTSSQQQQPVEKRVVPPMSSLSQPTSTGFYVVSSNGYPGMGTNAPPVIMQHSVNDGSTGFSPELEFGSLGPVHSG